MVVAWPQRRTGDCHARHRKKSWQASWSLAVTASAAAAVACIPTWMTDFRADLPKIDVPFLVLHGDADQVLPLDKTPSGCRA